MDRVDRDTKEYELGVLVRKEEDLPALTTLIREHSGEIVTDFRAKRVALQYPIKKETEAIFAYTHFRAIGESTKELQTELNLRQDVLRSIVVILPKEEKKREESSGDLPQKRATAPRSSTAPSEPRKQTSWPLSNEALEKKIEEILK